MALASASAFSDKMEANILNWFKGSTFPAAPATVFVGLFTTQPADAGTSASPQDGTEVTTTANTSTGYAAYARQSITTTTAFSAIAAASGDSTGQQISNSNQINFPTNGNTSLGVATTGIGIYDAVTAGNLLWYIAFTQTQTIAVGTPLQIAAAGLVIQVD